MKNSDLEQQAGNLSAEIVKAFEQQASGAPETVSYAMAGAALAISQDLPAAKRKQFLQHFSIICADESEQVSDPQHH